MYYNVRKTTVFVVKTVVFLVVEAGLVCIFSAQLRKKIEVRLGLAPAGGAHPRRIGLFKSSSITKKKSPSKWMGILSGTSGDNGLKTKK